MITVQQLNQSQLKAVLWKKGPLLVLAGPGSGKTLVLAMHAAHLLEQSPGEHFRILGLSFTVKASHEMSERMQQYVGEEAHRVKACTFHAFCAEILRQHGSHLGLKPDFDVINEERDRLGILMSALERLPEPFTYIDQGDATDFLRAIDRMFTYGLSSSDLSRVSANQDQYQQMGRVFDAYLEALIEQNQLDFGAMLHFTRILLETKKGVARRVRLVYTHICVDEFQDTNMAQYQLLRLLAPEREANLFVVADDDQTIFQWNGADPKRINKLREHYDLKTIQLPENYRCPKTILDLANQLIIHNQDRAPGKLPLEAHTENSGNILLQSYANLSSELEGLCQHLKQIPELKRHQCLVIARSNKLLLRAEAVLHNENISAAVVARKSNYSSPAMRVLISCLKLARDPNSRNHLGKLCVDSSRLWLLEISAEEIEAYALIEKVSLFEAFLQELAQANHESAKAFARLCGETLIHALEFKTFLAQAIDIFDKLHDTKNAPYMSDYEDERKHWNDFYDRKKRERHEQLTLHGLLQEVDLTPKQRVLGKNYVRLQTVHTAKGTEFRYVFIIGMAEEHFPSYQALKKGKKSRAMEEERRACFVALTRASESLYLSYARNYDGYNKKPSSFLAEMGLDGKISKLGA